VQSLMIKATMPFYCLYLVYKILIVLQPAINGFKTEELVERMDVVKNVQLVPDIPTELVKKRARELQRDGQHVTFNDLLMTALSKTVYEYLRKETPDKTTDFVNLACPFSVRRKPQAIGDFEFNNDFSIVPLRFRLVSNFKEGLVQMNQDMNNVKKSLEPIGMTYIIKLLMFLPNCLRHFIMEDYAGKVTFGFSNVPGPKNKFVIAGYRCQALGFMMPVGWSLVGSFSIISHADVVKIGIAFDKAVMRSTKPFMDILLANLDEALGAEWR